MHALFRGFGWRTAGSTQQDLVDSMTENGVLTTPRIELAFRLVDRANFIPGIELGSKPPAASSATAAAASSSSSSPSPPPIAQPAAAPAPQPVEREQAYVDGPIKIGDVHLSAPHMNALVLEKLQLAPGQAFLNIGSGSGFLSCLASVLVGRGGRSHGIERLPHVVEHARARSRLWRKGLDRMRREQRALAAANEVAKASQVRQESRAESADEADDGDVVMTDEEEKAPSSITTAAASVPGLNIQTAAQPLRFPVDLASPKGGAPRRGVISMAGDLVEDAPSDDEQHGAGIGASSSVPRAAPRPQPTGDSEARQALRNSVVGMHVIAQRLLDPSPSPSPSPAVSPAGSPMDESIPMEWSASSPSPPPTNEFSSYQLRCDQPIPRVAEPHFLVGDAFDLDPAVCGLYDRIYIGAATPESFIPQLTALLHPRGRLVGPFDEELLLLTKSADGTSVTREVITQCAYAPMTLPDPSEAATRAERAQALRFPPFVFQPPSGFSCLPPNMQRAINAMRMLQRRDGAECAIGRLPLDLLCDIFTYLPIDAWLNRATGDVPWAPDVHAMLSRAREKLSSVQAQLSVPDLPAAGVKHLAKDVSEALLGLQQVASHLEVKLPMQPPCYTTGDFTGDPVLVQQHATDVAALQELRVSSQHLCTRGAHASDDTLDQLVYLHWRGYSTLITLCAKQRDDAQCIKYAKRLLALCPSDPNVWRTLAHHLSQDQELNEAAKAVAQALKVATQQNVSEEIRAPILALQADIQARLPAYRAQQQRVHDRLIALIVGGIMRGQAEIAFPGADADADVDADPDEPA